MGLQRCRPSEADELASNRQRDMLDLLQKESFEYFLCEVNPVNGLIADKTKPDWPASIAAVGLALAAYPVAVERGFISREEAAAKTLATLRFLRNCAQARTDVKTGWPLECCWCEREFFGSPNRSRTRSLSVL